MPKLPRANIAVTDHVTADKRADTQAMLEKHGYKMMTSCITIQV